RGRRAADRTGVREVIGDRLGRPFLEHHPHDLRDHVSGALDHDGVADADIDRLVAADGRAGRVDALDVVFVVEGDILDHDAADTDWGEARHGRQRAGAADLDIDALDGRGRLLGRELVRHGPARLAGDKAPAALQLEVVELVDDAIDIVAERRAL